MEVLTSLFVGKPQNILLVSILLFLLYLALRFKHHRLIYQAHALSVNALGWFMYAAWEWLVQAKTPKANIRVDLLMIWPVLGILLIWLVWRIIRSSTR